MNNEQEKSRFYEIVAQSIQKRIIYPSRENVTLNHDTWELEYEPVYEGNSQADNSYEDNSDNDSSYENNHYKKRDQTQISNILTFVVVCLILYFLGILVKPFYEVYQQDSLYFEKHNEIHSQIVKRIKNYERPVDDIRKVIELHVEEVKLGPRLVSLKRCEQCSYLEYYVEALLCFDEYKQDGNIKHIEIANKIMDKIPTSYQGDCADQIKYSRDYFQKLHRTGGIQTSTKQKNDQSSFFYKVKDILVLSFYTVMLIIVNLRWLYCLREFISLMLEIFKVAERKNGRRYFPEFFKGVWRLIYMSILVLLLNGLAFGVLFEKHQL